LLIYVYLKHLIQRIYKYTQGIRAGPSVKNVVSYGIVSYGILELEVQDAVLQSIIITISLSYVDRIALTCDQLTVIGQIK